MPGPGGPGGGPRGGRGRFGAYGYGGGNRFGSMMRPPGGYWGENSSPLSPDRPRTGGKGPLDSGDGDGFAVFDDVNLGIRKAQTVAQRQYDLVHGIAKKPVKDDKGRVIGHECYKLHEGFPLKGEKIRFGCKFKGFFVGLGHIITKPFADLRDSFAEDSASVAFRDKTITQEAFNERMYVIQERKLWRALKYHYISREEYDMRVDALDQKYLSHLNGGPANGGPTR